MRTPVLAAMLLAWLAYGPGGVALQATAACRHALHHHAAGGDHHSAPASRTCFCDAMTGHGTPSPPCAAIPEFTPPGVMLPAERSIGLGDPPTLPSRPARPPEPPPPIS